ncbi:MAG: FAD-dependent oxidoreductase [Bryobacteraceae bacterium]
MTRTRRNFIAGSAALIGLSAKAEKRIDGSFVNDSFDIGHKLRARLSPVSPKRMERVPVVIIGGGIAGLSAAWRLQKRGFRDFVLLEMNAEAGGNSRSGKNAVSEYPWAAHYVPVPGVKATYVRELFEELGVLQNGVWNERYLCFTPQERLFLHGRWQESIEPAAGLTERDREQFRKLEDLLDGFRASGAFQIPMEPGLSAATANLDRVNFAQWLREQGIDSEPALWYMNYCCRDDYGALAKDVSAWAGIHYFSSRTATEKGPLTWPEGNGWILKRLLQQVGAHVRMGQMVVRIESVNNRYRIRTTDAEYIANSVIFAAPMFLAPYLMADAPKLPRIEYSPWLTANLTLDRPPSGGATSQRAWDNVVYGSPSLGYVDATHQTVRTHVDRTVWTYYWALGDRLPAEARKLLLERDWNYWKETILTDLARVHPNIRDCVSRIDIMRIGHAMARPTPGLIFSPERRALAKSNGRFRFANSDVSGFSIFEEAQYRGVTAADGILQAIG